MKIRQKIPQALINLKSMSGTMWPKFRRYLVRYIEHKQRLVGHPDARFYDSLMRRFYDEGVDKIEFIDVPEDKVILMKDHLHNVISTLYKEVYRADLFCYITDSYAYNVPSGNKKYPNL